MLYEILKTAKLGTAAASDMFTGLLAQKMPFAKDSGEIAELSGVPPLRFKSNGKPLLDWRITGSGNPTPQNPVDANGVGVRTANLFDGVLIDGYASENYKQVGDPNIYKTIKIMLPAGTYTVSYENPINIIRYIHDNLYEYNKGTNVTEFTFTTMTDNYVYLGFRLSALPTIPWDNSNIMLNTGSTALPYEPYGYKIPVTCGGVTTDIYIGDSPLYDGDSISMADTGIVIPTVRGNNVLTVDTTVQPSEVYIKYKKIGGKNYGKSIKTFRQVGISLSVWLWR